MTTAFDPVVFGCQVLARMKSRSCREVAAEIGISPATVNRITRGKMPDVPSYLAVQAWLTADAA